MNNTIHQTDLFHLHQDPDDHYDLACQFALMQGGESSLHGVVIDYPDNNPFGDPALVAVGQLNFLTDRHVPAAVGISNAGLAAGKTTSGGVRLILDTLEECAQKTSIQIVGSCRDVAMALRQAPDLFERKCSGIYLNAGTGLPTKELEFNVQLDAASYRTIFEAPCPVYWCPCFQQLGVNNAFGEYGTVYQFRQGDVYSRLPDRLRTYFEYAMGRENDLRWVRYFDRPRDPRIVKFIENSTRNMYSTAGILYAAGLTVTCDGHLADAKTSDAVFEFLPVSVQCDEQGQTVWEHAHDTNRYLFHATDSSRYAQAMTSALIELLNRLQ